MTSNITNPYFAAKATIPLRRAGVRGHEATWEGVFKHGSYHEAKQLGVNESVMWGEYFFVETLARVVQAP